MTGLGGQWIGLAGAVAVLAIGLQAQASAWTQYKGEGQVIVKYEHMSASSAYNPSGRRVDLPGGRTDQTLSALVEYGLTDHVTLRAKSDVQRGRDRYLDYSGRGAVELGAQLKLYQDDSRVISVYGGYSHGGVGRNAGYAVPGQGDHDWELRLLAGRSYHRVFTETQVSRLWRVGLPDETRLDLTVGSNLNPDWLVLGQVFAGRTEAKYQSDTVHWISAEVGAVRHFNHWSAQIGWRASLAGQETAASSGPVLAIWRRF